MMHWNPALDALGLAPTAQQRLQLSHYLDLLQRWNQVYNLTAVRDPAQMLALHLWDSLSVEPYVQAATCLDVGSGAGLPGIPLAIMRPEQPFTLLDSNGKKARFIQQAVVELGLRNVQVVQARVEQWQPPQRYSAIVSRAFASLADFVQFAGQHLIPEGVLYAMKGRFPSDELEVLPMGWVVVQSHVLQVPDLNAERHLLELMRTA